MSHQDPPDGFDYPYAVTMDEVIEIVIEHLEIVRNTDDLLRQGVHLKMASRAMRCALEIYGDWSATQVPKEEPK
jgi:hypothetical protein